MRPGKIRLLSLALGASLLPFFGGGLAHAESLDASVQSAVQNHPSVAAAQARQAYAQEEAEEQYSGFLPQVSVNSSGGRIYGDNATSRGLSTTRGAGWTC